MKNWLKIPNTKKGNSKQYCNKILPGQFIFYVKKIFSMMKTCKQGLSFIMYYDIELYYM